MTEIFSVGSCTSRVAELDAKVRAGVRGWDCSAATMFVQGPRHRQSGTWRRSGTENPSTTRRGVEGWRAGREDERLRPGRLHVKLGSVSSDFDWALAASLLPLKILLTFVFAPFLPVVKGHEQS